MRVRLGKEPTNKQKEIVRQECIKEFDLLLANLNRDVCIQILHMFRFKRGYGKKRLIALANDLKEVLDTIHSRYEMKESDTVWICEKKLRESGIDVDEIL
jgi:hypothetical protein